MPMPDAGSEHYGPALELSRYVAAAAGPAAVPAAPADFAPPPPPPPQAAPGEQPASVSPVDMVRLLQLTSRRVFTWPGSGPIDDEEAALLRQVITWRPSEGTGAALVVASIFLPRIMSHPKVSAWIEKHGAALMGSDDDTHAALPAPEPEPAPAAAPAPKQPEVAEVKWPLPTMQPERDPEEVRKEQEAAAWAAFTV